MVATPHRHVATKDQLGMDSACAIGLTRPVVHIANDLSEHRVTHRPRGRATVAASVEPGHRDADLAANDFDREAFAHDL
jgi:hypothetical protein